MSPSLCWTVSAALQPAVLQHIARQVLCLLILLAPATRAESQATGSSLADSSLAGSLTGFSLNLPPALEPLSPNTEPQPELREARFLRRVDGALEAFAPAAWDPKHKRIDLYSRCDGSETLWILADEWISEPARITQQACLRGALELSWHRAREVEVRLSYISDQGAAPAGLPPWLLAHLRPCSPAVGLPSRLAPEPLENTSVDTADESYSSNFENGSEALELPFPAQRISSQGDFRAWIPSSKLLSSEGTSSDATSSDAISSECAELRWVDGPWTSAIVPLSNEAPDTPLRLGTQSLRVGGLMSLRLLDDWTREPARGRVVVVPEGRWRETAVAVLSPAPHIPAAPSKSAPSEAAPAESAPSESGTTITADGWARLAPVSPGRYRLLIQPSEAKTAPHFLGPFEIVAGTETRLPEHRVPRVGSLEVTWEASPSTTPMVETQIAAFHDPGCGFLQQASVSRSVGLNGEQRLTLEDLAPGRWRVRLSFRDAGGGILSLPLQNIEVPSADSASAHFHLQGQLYRGRILHGDQPLQTRIELRSSTADNLTTATATSNDAGTFLIALPSPGTYTPFVHGLGLSPRRLAKVEVSGKDRAIELRLPLGEVRGQVVDEDGQPVPAGIALRPLLSRSSSLSLLEAVQSEVHALTDANGQFEVSALDEGQWQVEAIELPASASVETDSVDAHGLRRSELVFIEVESKEGEVTGENKGLESNDLQLTLRAPEELEIQMIGVDGLPVRQAEARARLHSSGGATPNNPLESNHRATSDQEGKLRLRGLSPGTLDSHSALDLVIATPRGEWHAQRLGPKETLVLLSETARSVVLWPPPEGWPTTVRILSWRLVAVDGAELPLRYLSQQAPPPTAGSTEPWPLPPLAVGSWELVRPPHHDTPGSALLQTAGSAPAFSLGTLTVIEDGHAVLAIGDLPF
ncbi:MAG: carboxypeptidase-like regulatory domain-containing protein [Acidobacteriota bacterium]